MPGIIDLLVPKEKRFLEWLKNQVILVEKNTKLLCRFCQKNQIDADKVAKALKVLKKQRDKQEEISKKIIANLHQTFITPIDSAEILSLTSNLNRLSLSLVKIAAGLDYLKISQVDTFSLRQLKVLQNAAQRLALIFDNLLAKTNINHIARISLLEDKADEIHRQAVGQLFADTVDPVEIMKRKELYELVEEAIDDTKAVADKIELVLINQA